MLQSAHLLSLGDVVKQLVTAVAVADLALLLGLGLGDQGPNSPELVLAVPDGDLLMPDMTSS